LASVFEQIGGKPAVSAAVDGLYERLLADPVLAPYFAGTDMDRQKRHMRAFMAVALGGADLYAGRDMSSAHAGLDITHDASTAWSATSSTPSSRSACPARSSRPSATSSPRCATRS
jgi:truncated hemoglobin YjbI